MICAFGGKAWNRASPRRSRPKAFDVRRWTSGLRLAFYLVFDFKGIFQLIFCNMRLGDQE